MGERVRKVVLIRGVVQGVGFRPAVHRAALAWRVGGWVRNRPGGVEVAVEGSPKDVEAFLHQVLHEPPPHARILGVEVNEEEALGEEAFAILPSLGGEGSTICPADVATCDACLQELFDPTDRRYRYPFINCTECGPRYTAVRALPYDRPLTSMACFPMCTQCEAEFHDPHHRRYHAQPNACPQCGPRVWVVDRHGTPLAGQEPLRLVSSLLRQGAIVAIKGLGGFHLAVDATAPDAVRRLRRLKGREAKPLAVMVADLAWARRCAALTEEAEALLQSPARPIVVVPARVDSPLAPEVAPGIGTVGLMLPYTPLHHLLLRDGDQTLPPLVMTSGNMSEEPIAVGNREALARLGHCADAFLLHNRDIVARADDSVVQPVGSMRVFIRRSRGYVPLPIHLPDRFMPALGVGAFLKATPCLLVEDKAFLGPHVGDLSTVDAVRFHAQVIEHLQRLSGVRPLVVGCDLHPDFPSTRWAEASGIPMERVQHHHAHVVAAALEHGILPPVVGLAMDGTGLGLDGRVWGCELLVANRVDFQRLASLWPLPLPGKDAAVVEPWRAAVGAVWASWGEEAEHLIPLLFPQVDARRLRGVYEAVRRGINTISHSSCGRLFDVAAALSGVCAHARFEAEAAMQLERCAREDPEWPAEPYPMDLLEGFPLLLDPRPLVRAMIQDRLAGATPARMAARFHLSVVEWLTTLVTAALRGTGADTVVLTGGCMLNTHLSVGLVRRLHQAGLRALVPSQVPVGDGSVSMGQAAVAAWRAEVARRAE